MMIKGLIFDLDGVITDTAEYHYLAWQLMSQDEGWEFDRQLNEKLRGVSRGDSMDIILQHNEVIISEERKAELMEKKNNLYISLLDRISESDFLPGVKNFLIDLKAKGYLIALGSASKNASKVLDNLNAREYFDVIGDGNSVSKSKPAPDLFVWAGNQLGLNPEECVVVEDAEAGVDAAHAAGMKAIGIGPDDRVGAAEIVLKDTSLLTIEVVESLLI